jgi:hypothetical protein
LSPDPHVRHGGAPDEPPPFGSWGRLYGAVLAALLAELALLAWLSQSFR